MCKGGGDGGAKKARQEEEARQARIRAGMASIDDTFSAFGPEYYDQRSDAYMTFALPQLDDQYAEARKQLTYALSRGGLLSSSAGAGKTADLQKQYDQQRLALASRAADLANQARRDVEDSRSTLISQLNATGNADAASQAAASRAMMLNQMPAFEPLGPIFQNVAAGIAQNRPPGEGIGSYVGKLFQDSGRGGSQRVVR